ncbi:PstS family phosphate ABC transporter substrate-binding protein [Mariniblastus sp.]|nr:PstS family phosphate ABC transporter substrate-binding protein [Mariniblastus sp.]
MKLKLTTLALLVSALIFVGCDKPDSDGESGGTTSNLEGTINVEGSSTVEPISLKAKEMFNAKNPKVNIGVSGQGTGNGFKALAKKEVDFSDASRPIKQKEFDLCKEAGVKFIEVPVAYDGLSIVVNKDNDFITELTIDQLKKIFREDFAAKSWKEVDESWPDEKIQIFAPGINSGTHDYFVEVIGKKDKKGLRPGDEYCTLSEDDKALVTGVEGDENSIGFFGFSYYEANKDALKIVPIVDPKTEKAVTPSMATIESGEYAPFSRPLFIYVNPEQYTRLEVKKFVDFYVDNAKEIVTKASYVPLPDSVYSAAKTHLEKGLTGTHYLTEGGEKRPGGIVELYKEENLIK